MRNETAKAEKSAERFFSALRDVFVGAPVQQRMKAKGERSDFSLIPSPLSLSLQSGFINLMRIKAHYYEKGVFPRLKTDIEKALKPFPGFKQELFDKLYDFFHRLRDVLGEIVRQSTVEFSYDEE